jgi:hypothetical protein
LGEGWIPLDLVALIKDYGPFIALVVFVMYENKNREKKYQDREGTFIEETRQREQKYIEREDKYISVIERLTDSYEKIQSDVSFIKTRFAKRAPDNYSREDDN